MARTENKRMICAILAAVMLLSNIPVAVFAQEDTYCGLEHEHEEACYVAPATESTTEPATEAPTEKITEPPTEPPTKAPAGAEMTLQQKLLAAETLRQLHDLLMEDKEKTRTLTIEELAAVKAHAEALYAGIAEPTQDDADYYELITGTIAYLEGELALAGEPEMLPETRIELTEELAKAPLQDGQYYLTQNLQLTAYAFDKSAETEGNVAHIAIPENGNVQIDLNGFEIIGNKTGSVIITSSNSSLTILDSSAEQTGGITGGKTQFEGGAIRAYGALTINGGNIHGNNAQNGGGIYSEAALTINGGSIYGNRATNGGGVYSKNEITIWNGYLHSNTASAQGGAIYANTIKVHGGTIGDTGFTIMWEGEPDTVYPTVYETGYVEDIAHAGKSNTAGQGGAVYVKGTFSMDGGVIAGNSSTQQGGAVFCEHTTFTMADGCIVGNRSGGNGGAVYFQYTTATISGGQIRYNRTTAYSGAINANIGTTLTIKDCADISYNSCHHNGGAIGIEDNGTGTTVCTIEGGTLTYNCATSTGSNSGRGGAIRCVATLYIKDGTIAHNKARTQGGAIHASTDNRKGVRVANVYLQGGKICNNIAAGTGGGVCIESETNKEVTFTMTGCRVENNQSGTSGGGIYFAAKSGTLVANLEGGSFADNTAQNGAGLFVDVEEDAVKGIVNISGTELLENKAALNGGGLYLTAAGDASVELNVSAGKLIGNTATANGGAAYISGGNFTMSGGNLGEENAANTAVLGGGVYVAGGSATVSGGSVQYNTATDGAGIYVNGGSATVSGTGIIANNAATESGGGAYISGGDFTIDGENAVIESNTAENGAGIYLTGGLPNLSRGYLRNNTATNDGGGIYIDQQQVELAPAGHVFVTGNQADRGAGIFISGTDGTDAGFRVNNSNGGIVEITDNVAAGENGTGAGVCISNGYFDLSADNIVLQRNRATSGGAVAVLSGNFAMSGGTIGGENNGNSAENGGAVFVDGGNVDISGGSILSNTADVNGGGIAVNNGQVVMSGGSVSGNTATTGEGGGMYVSSTGTNDVSVKVFSGALENNTAAKTGGAVAVRGESGNITVQIGVNENHHFVDGKPTYPIAHTDDGKTYSHESCPLIKNNASGSSGGAFYINSSQSEGADNETRLNIYCLTGEGNHTDGDTNPLNEHMSNFLMVEGGRVYLSTGETYENVEGTPNDSPDNDDVSGNMTIKGSIHVVSGVLELFGSKDNPRLEGALTIDLQDDDDRYIDHRGSEDKLTISYHENFFRPDGTPDSAQTAFDVISGQTHTIYSGLYVHEGYKLHGWNIDKEANAVSTTDGWYEANTVYEFRMPDESHPAGTVENGVYYGDLTLYAIWKVNGYYAAYVAGVPTDQEWTGETRTEPYTYDEEYELLRNWFVWPGHVFAGWKLPDGTVKQPGENIRNLTTENAATVTITAQWTVCEHPDEHVSFSSNGTDTITKTCNLCGLKATAKLSAQDAVYDGNRHEATLECSDADFWNPQIQYVGQTIRPQDADENWKPANIAENRLCIGAGNYAAGISGGDRAVSVQYTIAKAKQAAPQTRPTYKQPEEGSNIVSIDLLPTDEQTSPQSGAQAEYFVRYYDNGTEITEKTVDTDTSTAGIQHELTEALRTYAVLIGYPETDDYLPSDLIAAETTFVFAGSLHLTIKAEEGIDFWPGAAEEKQMTIYVKLRDGYYLTGEGFDFKKESSTEGYDVEKITIKKAKPDDPLDYGYFVGAEPATKETHITITIGGVKKIADIRSFIREKQHFSDFADQTDPVISNDSAFTLRYDITAYDTEVFDQPVLSFTSSDAAKQLPAGTTVILRDRNDGSYWYTEIETASSRLELDSFKKMAAGGGSYTAQTGDLKLQFIVDFSRAGQMDAESLSCTLTANKKDPAGKAVTLTGTETVKLAGAQLTLGKVEGAGLTQTVKITAGAGGAASKYDHRDVALVLEPATALPKDAMIRMVLDGTHSDWRPDKSGKFIISLGNFRSLNTGIVLELNSAMFPLEETTYLMDAKLYLSGTDAEIAPLNTTPLHTVALSFTSDRDKTGVSIAVGYDQRLFTTAEDITAAITVKPEDYTDAYNLVVELHQELDGVAFGDTTLKPRISGNSYTFDLAGRATGDYCIVATLQTKAGYVINEARYYFIVEPEKSN